MRRTFTIVAAATLALFSAVPARTQDAASTNHVLKSTFFDGGAVKLGGLPKPGFYVFTTPVSFSCTAPCILEVEIMEQLGGNKTAKNVWGISAEIDNGKAFTPALNQGALPTDQSFVIGNYSASLSLRAGAHTAEPEVFVSAPAAIANFHITYHIYQP